MLVQTLKADHLTRLELQPEQQYFKQLISNPDDYVKMVSDGDAYAIVEGDETMCAFGIIELWPNRSMIWALMSANCGPHMTGMVRIGRRMVKTSGSRRVEAHVDCDFKAGHRFMKLLGFDVEAERMRSYEPDGRDCTLYARIQ
jgi:hypothetical protein